MIAVMNRQPAVFALLLAALLTGLPGLALAQDAMTTPKMVGSVKGRVAPTPPPSALPGAQMDKDRVIPAEKGTADLSPNDALFDAITRGDINSAQDAINRGADFNARNVLGLTPLDESIDLGRNNITFLLLSLRPSSDSAANTSAPAKPITSAPPKLTNALSAPQPGTLAPRIAATPAATETSAAAGSTNSAPPAPQLPASGNAGAPNPKSGFLGFGG